MFRLKHKGNYIKVSAKLLLSISALLCFSMTTTFAATTKCPKGSVYSAQDKACISTNASPTPSNVCPNGSIYSVQDKACVPDVGTTPTPNGGQSVDPAVSCTGNRCDLIAKYVNPTIKVLAAVFGTIAAISLILGGINFTTSEGDPQKAARAKSRITNTIIATVAFLFLYAFLQFLIPGGLFNR